MQRKLVSCWGLRKWWSVPLYAQYGLGRTLHFYAHNKTMCKCNTEYRTSQSYILQLTAIRKFYFITSCKNEKNNLVQFRWGCNVRFLLVAEPQSLWQGQVKHVLPNGNTSRIYITYCNTYCQQLVKTIRLQIKCIMQQRTAQLSDNCLNVILANNHRKKYTRLIINVFITISYTASSMHNVTKS